ncbi:MAG: hypothetical protein JSV96_08985 [Candidatus Aminicenantes bacterium]|nr:MAG: hypothetical protein JSV96_08985 [Candidatus Aminicenantes bacterium]
MLKNKKEQRMNTIEFNNVWKKFKKGEKFNSVRDAVPKLFRRIISKPKQEDSLGDKEFWALKEVSFVMEKGGFVGIMGSALQRLGRDDPQGLRVGSADLSYLWWPDKNHFFYRRAEGHRQNHRPP